MRVNYRIDPAICKWEKGCKMKFPGKTGELRLGLMLMKVLNYASSKDDTAMLPN